MNAKPLRIGTIETPTIKLAVFGHLELRGWNRTELQLRADDPDSLTVEQDQAEVRVHCESGCSLSVPEGASVEIERAAGSAQISALRGKLKIGEVGGSVHLRDLDSAEIGQVYGNLMVDRMLGDLEAKEIFGNALIRAADGTVRIHSSVKGNLTLEDAAGVEATVWGNARLRIDPQPGQEYKIEAHGSIRCVVAPQANADLRLYGERGSILVDLPGESPTTADRERALRIGKGGAQLELRSRGRLQVSQRKLQDGVSPEAELEALYEIDQVAEEISEQIEHEMEILEEQLNQRLSEVSQRAGEAGLTEEAVEEIVEQARQASQDAARWAQERAQTAALRAQERAQNAARRAQEKLARKLEKARRRAQKQARAAERWGTPARAAAPEANDETAEPVSEEERLTVLRMLAQNKISLDEAERLLAALEGDGG